MATVLTRQVVTAAALPSAETVLMTSAVTAIGPPQPNEPAANQAVRVTGTINVNPAGTGTTAIVIKCRQGSTTGGTQVGQSITHTLAAAASASIPFSFEDASGYLAQPGGGQYSITVTQTSGSANGTATQAEMQVEQ